MVHGDRQGLILPPRVAPYQVVIIPIWRKEAEKADVLAMVQRVKPVKGPALMGKAEAIARDQETERVLKLMGIQ